MVHHFSQLYEPNANAYDHVYGYRRLMEILRICPTLTDIQLIGWEYDSPRYRDLYGPLPLSVFSALPTQVWWSNISAIFFTIRWTQEEWLHLKSMLLHFHKLKSLILELFLDDQQVESPDDVAENGSIDDPSVLPQSLDSLTFEIRGDPRPSSGCKF